MCWACCSMPACGASPRGRRSFDDVMRLAYQRYGGDRGFTADEFRRTAEEVAGRNMKAWFAKTIEPRPASSNTARCSGGTACDLPEARAIAGSSRSDRTRRGLRRRASKRCCSHSPTGGLRPPDPLTRSLAGPRMPHSARVARSLRSLAESERFTRPFLTFSGIRRPWAERCDRAASSQSLAHRCGTDRNSIT